MDKIQKYLGVVADVIGVVTFIASFFSISKSTNVIWISAMGDPLSPFRLLSSTILVFSSAYALSKLFGLLINNSYNSDKPLRMLLYGIIGAISAWVTMFILQYLLYGPDLNIGFLYRVGFTVLVGFCCWLNNYFLSLIIEKSPHYREEFESTFTFLSILLYAIFWFKPAFSAFSAQ